MLEHFFGNASDDLMADAMGFVGRSVGNDEGQIPQPKLDRLMTLWQERMDIIGVSEKPGIHLQELAPFGWWFRSSQWDEQWALDQLLDVLESTKFVETAGHVVQRLADLSTEQPNKTILALRLMIEGDEQGWHIGLWSDDARTVLNNAIQSGDTTTSQQAVDLIHYLASRNNPQFGDLLPQSDPV